MGYLYNVSIVLCEPIILCISYIVWRIYIKGIHVDEDCGTLCSINSVQEDGDGLKLKSLFNTINIFL